MSHGPRRRRRRSTPQQLLTKSERLKRLKLLKAQLARMPLYCWKVLVDCRRYRGHVCCPVMPQVVGGGGAAALSVGSRWWTSRGSRSRRDSGVAPSRRTWEPFYRCPGVNCRDTPHDECCQVGSFISYGSFSLGLYCDVFYIRWIVSYLNALWRNLPLWRVSYLPRTLSSAATRSRT